MDKKLILWLFVFSFVFSFVFFSLRGNIFYISDGDMWSKQAYFFETEDNKQFNFERGYGHPGGPIIEGTIVLHKILKIPYNNPDNILTFFVVIFNSLFIAGTCVLAYLLKKNKYWWLTVLSTLSINILYEFATPPTAIVTPLISFLCLFTLYLCENKEKIKISQLSLWALTAGLAIATRVDIGGFCILVFLILLKSVINLKKIFYVITGIIFSFIIFDPYMWYMPIKHIKDLFFKIFFHYAEITPQHMSFFAIISISIFAFLSISFLTCILLSKGKIKLPMPVKFSVAFLIMTVILYFVFLTARIQAERYFQPIISIWEIFLPLFIFPFLPKILTSYNEEFKQKIVIFSLIGFQIFSLFSLYFFYYLKI